MDQPVAVAQSSGRDRLNIHGAIDLETGQTVMKDVLVVDAAGTILLLMGIEAMYPHMRLIHVFLDNARYHHAKLVQASLARPGCRIRLHFVPAYCPHLNPIERLWGLMHLLSTPLSAQLFTAVARVHWAIENGLHWVLDVTTNEDRKRNWKDHGPENIGLLRRLALNLAKLEGSKGSVKGKLKRARWNDEFLCQLLAQFAKCHMR